MKILNIAETIQGGIASYLNDLSPALTKEYGSENVIYAVPHSQIPELVVPDDCLIEAMPPRKRSVMNLIKFAGRTFKLVRKHKPDVIHVHSTVAGLVVRLVVPFARRTIPKSHPGSKPKVIYTPHGWSFVMDIAGWKQRIYSTMERMLSPFTDTTVLVSESEKTAAADAGFGKSALAKCLVIETGVPDTTPIALAEKADGLKWQTSAHKVNLLFAGRLDKQKGFDVLLEAIAQIKQDDICLHVFGEAVADGGERKVFEDQTAPGKPAIIYYGWQQRDKLLAFLPEHDAVVMPSRWEGLPILALEACRAGIPLVCSDIPVLKDVVEHLDSGIACPTDDATSLATALEAVGDTSWPDRCRAARKTYEERFMFEAMLGSVKGLYESGTYPPCSILNENMLYRA